MAYLKLPSSSLVSIIFLNDFWVYPDIPSFGLDRTEIDKDRSLPNILRWADTGRERAGGEEISYRTSKP